MPTSLLTAAVAPDPQKITRSCSVPPTASRMMPLRTRCNSAEVTGASVDAACLTELLTATSWSRPAPCRRGMRSDPQRAPWRGARRGLVVLLGRGPSSVLHTGRSWGRSRDPSRLHTPRVVAVRWPTGHHRMYTPGGMGGVVRDAGDHPDRHPEPW